METWDPLVWQDIDLQAHRIGREIGLARAVSFPPLLDAGCPSSALNFSTHTLRAGRSTACCTLLSLHPSSWLPQLSSALTSPIPDPACCQDCTACKGLYA
eukprot:1157701-Pelagomonas_calceolata.AAC.3